MKRHAMNHTIKAAKFHARASALKIARVPLASLVHDPDNPRTHDERNLAGIKASIEQFGQVEPLVVRRGDWRVVGGNGRLDAMLALGWTDCDVVLIDVDDAQARALSVALNRTAELGGWDPRRLAAILDEAAASPAFGASALGFTADEVRALMDGAASALATPSAAAGPTLRERFGCPPFSVFDARQGYWQDRKREWIALGLRGHLGRGENVAGGGRGTLGFSEQVYEYATGIKTARPAPEGSEP